MQHRPGRSGFEAIDATADEVPHIVGHLGLVVEESMNQGTDTSAKSCPYLLGAGHPKGPLVIDKGSDGEEATLALFESLNVGGKLPLVEDGIDGSHTDLALRNDSRQTCKAVHGTRCSFDNEIHRKVGMAVTVCHQVLMHLRHLRIADHRDAFGAAMQHDIHQPIHHSLPC